MDLSGKKVLVRDQGLYLHLARKIGEKVGECMYYMDDPNPYPDSDKASIGVGFPEITRVYNWKKALKKADMVFFPDVYDGEDLQQDLYDLTEVDGRVKARKLPVAGSLGSEKAELDRKFFYEHLESLKMPVSPFYVADGLSDLMTYLDGKGERWLKRSYFRGDFETYHYTSMNRLKGWANDLRSRIGSRADTIEILAQNPIPAVLEAGWDGFCLNGEYTSNGMVGYEIKDKGYVSKIFATTPEMLNTVNMNMSPLFKSLGFQGHFSTEIRVTKAGKVYFTDPTCYSDDTEVLTDKGWRRFQDLDKTEKICTLNPNTRQIEYHKPSAYVGYEYNGDLIHLTSPKKVVDILVTPNHSVWGSKRKASNPIDEFRADNLPGKLSIPRTGKWVGEEPEVFTVPKYSNYWNSGMGMRILKEHYDAPVDVPIETWLKFMAIYLSDGSCSRWGVNISQFDRINEFEQILFNLPFSVTKTDVGFQISSVQLRAYLKRFGTCSQKFIPVFVKNLSPRLINVFLDAYILADGSSRKGKDSKQRRIYTTSVTMANDMQELFLKSGSVADIMVRKAKGTVMSVKGKKEYSRNYDVLVVTERSVFTDYWLEGKGTAKADDYIEYQYYSGMVYDVEVQNHIIYVRRNGKPLWSGNCRAPSPPSELMCEIYTNYPEIIYSLAHSKMPVLHPIATYGAEIILTSPWYVKHELCVEYPKDLEKYVKLKNATRRHGVSYCVPNGNDKYFGAVVGWGSTMNGAIQQCLDVYHEIGVDELEFDENIFSKAREEIVAGRQFGLGW